ncbi:hypothetical protein F5Y04DRAFT_246226 [Hypomontagnella monticulosa]|nr:hypothetical protein F5Y04DRAFT_246226 [Hypomontagnella monticulosa]
MGGEDSTSAIPVAECLDASHRDALNQAVSNILSTEIALETYAQIIDGLPLGNVAWDRYHHKLRRGHPISSHRELCPGALECAQEMRDAFNIDLLKFEPELLQAYQFAPTSSRQYQLRLLELTAISLHQIAAYLFRKSACVHDLHHSAESGLTIKDITSWQPPPDNWLPVTPWPTLFTHPGFTAVGQYPDGEADLVGYWAEDRILGGVMLFERSQDWVNEDEPDVYFQSSRSKRTYLVYQLLDEQQQGLLDFIRIPRSKSTPRSCPIPLSCSTKNTVRIDPTDAGNVYKIYRHPWDILEQEKRSRFVRDRDVISSTDYPEVEDQLRRLLRRNG